MNKYYAYILILTLLLFSCGSSKHYRLASEVNTTEAYEAFIKRYPTSKESTYAKAKLVALYEQESFQSARRINTINSYKSYLTDYPRGKYAGDAKNEITKIENKEREEREKVEWETVLSENSLSSYQHFLKSNPNSKFASNAKNKIQEIDRLNWQKASLANSYESYKEYLNIFPNGLNSVDARNRIKQIEEDKSILPIWNRTQKANSYKAYQDFYNTHKYSSYGSLAKSKMDSIDLSAWNSAKSSNTISAYKKYLDSYPSGIYAEDASKKIVDLEVESIFKGNYGYLPPMTKKSSYSFGTQRPTSNKISIYNNTSYTLTVWYSGPDSKKIVLGPRNRTSFELTNGAYKVAASVDASNVTKYAGNERLDGGEYESEFYIQTR